jgi:2-dehydro-3-deoxyphosphooctonate aldolase (KDO 8-P synthase)
LTRFLWRTEVHFAGKRYVLTPDHARRMVRPMNMVVEPAPNPVVAVGKTRFGNALPLALIAGPCALESRDHAFDMAGALKEIAGRIGIGLVYKTSFDKANRTSAMSNRGIGLDGALPIFADIRATLGVPILTDVHEAQQCAIVAEVVDVLQIPAFLCRQTDLLQAAAATGRAVNVKKGQFLAPWDMANVVAKITGAGNPNVLVTERGASFGYNTLVSDMRALPILARTTGAPVIFDATHSVQQPGGQGTSSGGEREFVPVLARAAVAVGVAGVFIETHQDPDRAPSDGPNMVPLRQMEDLLLRLKEFDGLSKSLH